MFILNVSRLSHLKIAKFELGINLKTDQEYYLEV